MTHEEMITRDISVSIKELEEAPKYDSGFKMIRASKAVIIPKGTENGNATVDIQCTDADGNNYLIFITGKLVKMLAQAVEGVEQRQGA